MPMFAAAALAAALATQSAQGPSFAVPWFTIDGGGVLNSTGGAFAISGTIGQHDAGPTMTGGAFAIRGGFWTAPAAGGDDCPADWDGNGVVNAADVGAFLSAYFLDLQNGTFVADFDGNGVVNAADVGAFLSEYFLSIGPCP